MAGGMHGCACMDWGHALPGGAWWGALGKCVAGGGIETPHIDYN